MNIKKILRLESENQRKLSDTEKKRLDRKREQSLADMGSHFRQDNKLRKFMLTENPMPVVKAWAPDAVLNNGIDFRNQIFEVKSKKISGGFDDYGHEIDPIETVYLDNAKAFKTCHVRFHGGRTSIGTGSFVPNVEEGEFFFVLQGIGNDTSRFHHAASVKLGVGKDDFADVWFEKKPYMFCKKLSLLVPFVTLCVDGKEKITGFDLAKARTHSL